MKILMNVSQNVDIATFEIAGIQFTLLATATMVGNGLLRVWTCAYVDENAGCGDARAAYPDLGSDGIVVAPTFRAFAETVRDELEGYLIDEGLELERKPAVRRRKGGRR